MPMSATTKKLALLTGTVAGAVGLNLSVLSLVRAEVDGGITQTTETAIDQAELPQDDATATGAASTAGISDTETSNGDALTSAAASRPTHETTDTEVTANLGSVGASTSAAVDLVADPPDGTSEPAPSVSAPDVVTEYLSYEIEAIAIVTVAVHDGKELQFWSVEPEPGWSYQAEQDSVREVEIEFRRVAGGDETEVKLKLTKSGVKVEMDD